MLTLPRQGRLLFHVVNAAEQRGFLRACFINDLLVPFAIPQGLKTLVFKALFSTTEVVP
jgi:hypothetical protein